jgi:protein-disulfide isomerase
VSPWVPRVLITLITLGVAGAIVSISVGTGGPQAVDIEGRPEVQGLIAGLRQDESRLGEPDAPVAVEVFTDLRAVPSSTFELDVVDPVIEDYVRQGRVRLYMRHFSFAPSPVTEAAIAADAAGQQGYEWQYAELVLRNQDRPNQEIDEEFLKEIAEVTPGLDIDEWEETFDRELAAQRDDPSYTSQVDEDGKLAFDLKLPANPAVRACGPGGKETLVESPDLDEVRAMIERVEVPDPDAAVEYDPSTCTPEGLD